MDDEAEGGPVPERRLWVGSISGWLVLPGGLCCTDEAAARMVSLVAAFLFLARRWHPLVTANARYRGLRSKYTQHRTTFFPPRDTVSAASQTVTRPHWHGTRVDGGW